MNDITRHLDDKTINLPLSVREARRLDEILVLFQWDRDASNAVAHTIRRRIFHLIADAEEQDTEGDNA